jgi:hypothetical protein
VNDEKKAESGKLNEREIAHVLLKIVVHGPHPWDRRAAADALFKLLKVQRKGK